VIVGAVERGVVAELRRVRVPVLLEPDFNPLPMNAALTVAVVLIIAVGAAHSFLGERYILIRLFRRPDLPRLFGSDVFTKHTLRFAWHLTTVAWLGFAAILWVLGQGSAHAGIRVVSFVSLLSALLTFVGSRGRHLAWIAFLAIGAAAWLGAPKP
jgi:hypothetical protein